MQTPEEFMREFLAASVAESIREMESHQPFRRKFYTEDCYFDSRAGTIEMRKSEHVVSVSNSEKDTTVVAHLKTSFGHSFHQRYHLKPNGETWLIESVDSECGMCQARESIDPDCHLCGGTGWTSHKTRERLRASHDKKKNSPP